MAERRGLSLVTGAAVRVGRAIALHLADMGFDVVAHAHTSGDKLDSLAREVEAKGRRLFRESADLSRRDDVKALGARVVAAHGAVDVVVHNAALFTKVPFAQIDDDAYDRMQAVNVEAPFFLTQALLPALARAQEPVIVHLVDVAAERPYVEHAHYSVSKAGLAMLTRALARELAPHVRVVGVAPGIAIFPDDYSAELRAQIVKKVPLQREGTPEEMAAAVGFLVDARYLTGCILPVDGGRSVVF